MNRADRPAAGAGHSAGVPASGDWLLGPAAALGALVVYIATLSPGVTGEDSGELMAAAYLLGVPHPPGYPLWCLLAKLTTLVVPLGSVAWRINLFSALAGSATVFFVTRITRRLGAGRLASLAAGLLTAFSLDYWSQAVITEVYTLNTLFLVLCLWCVVRHQDGGGRRWLYGFAFAWGLSLTNHQIMAPAGLVMALYLAWLRRRAPLRRATLFGAAGLFLAGLLPLLYLPIRARADTLMNWGDPETLSSFLDHVTRAQYQFKMHEVPRSLGLFLGQLGTVAGYAWTQWSFVGLLACVGLWHGLRRRLGATLLVFSLLLLTTVVLTWYLNFRLEREDIVTGRAFYIAAWPLAAILIGLGLRWPGAFLARYPKSARAAGGPLVAALVVYPLLVNLPRDDRHADHLVHDFGLALLDTMDKNAILFPSSDHTTFPVLYYQAVEGRRTDIVVANKYGSVEPDLYRDMPERLRSKVDELRDERTKEAWVVRREAEKRPIYFSQKRSFPGLPDFVLAPVGLLYRLVRRDQLAAFRPRQEDAWQSARLRGLDTPFERLDYSGTMVLAGFHFARARFLFSMDRADEAEKEVAQAAAYAGDLKQTLNNIGSLLAEHGLADRAVPYFRQALEIDPDYAMGLRNLSQVLTSMGRLGETAELHRRLVAMNPRDAAARVDLARALNARGDLEESRDAYMMARILRPTDAGLAREVGTFLVYRLHDLEQGRQVLRESLELNPKQADLRRLLADLEHPTDRLPETPDPFADMPRPPGMPPPFPEMPRPPIPVVPLPQLPDPTKGLPGRRGGTRRR